MEGFDSLKTIQSNQTGQIKEGQRSGLADYQHYSAKNYFSLHYCWGSLYLLACLLC